MLSSPPESTSTSMVKPMITPLYLWAAIVAFWIPAVRQWSYDWSTNPQYFYGWAVPFLAAYLIYDRWPQRPVPGVAKATGFLMGCAILLALLQIPARWFGEANSDWWPVWWLYAGIVTGCSFILIYLGGGMTWARYFAFPILFVLTAVPWPTYFEIRFVQRLMGVDAEISATIASLMGIPAMAVGNLIQTPTGVLGVNEACSGIRSLQSSLMAAFFLTGLYRLKLGGGLLLVALGAAIAFVCNVVRTTFLTYQGAMNGIEAVGQWHDTAGFVILGVVLFSLFLISRFLEKSEMKSGKLSRGTVTHDFKQ